MGREGGREGKGEGVRKRGKEGTVEDKLMDPLATTLAITITNPPPPKFLRHSSATKKAIYITPVNDTSCIHTCIPISCHGSGSGCGQPAHL